MIQERVASPIRGAVGLTVSILLILAGIALIFRAAGSQNPLGSILLAVLALVLGSLAAAGLFTAQPNQAVVLILFGSYVGSVRSSGWWWTNPFITRRKLSLRARSLNGERIKVNDQHGNPVEIAAVVVWKVRHRAGGVRRGRLRAVRHGSERDRGAAPRQLLSVR